MNKKTLLMLAAALALGVLLGWGLFSNASPEAEVSSQKAVRETTFTCSMHPQIRQKEPGDCPICGMELIPVAQAPGHQKDSLAVAMSPTAQKLAQVQTITVGTTEPVKNISLTGKVQADARRVYSQTTHFPGRIEKLTVSFKGERVKEGQVLAYVYAPELIRAQEELLEAQKVQESQPALFRSALDKLQNWKLSEAQVQRVLNAKKPIKKFPIRADVNGYVLEKNVNQGDYLGQGDKLYTIADLSKVWLMFDVHESDLSWVDRGDTVHFKLTALPGEHFKGRISQVDPVIDPQTRVAGARVEVPNPRGRLLPEMLARGTVRTTLEREQEAVVVPETAVLWTGERSVVYVKTSTQQESFAMREVLLGASLNPGFVVKKGLSPGEEIVVNGTFSIDAAAQLAGKPSMMNPGGGAAMTGHDHGSSKAEKPKKKTSKASREAGVGDAKATLKPLLNAYLALKEALVKDDTMRAPAAADKLLQEISITREQALPAVWQQHNTKLQSAVEKAAQVQDMKALRGHFVAISAQLAPIIRAAKPVQQPLYLQFCPMANQNKGAYWLSRKVEVKNPYYGAAMLNCGEVKATIE
jgi:Cu(I)/Ag(I) efflux system membrane fusion protein